MHVISMNVMRRGAASFSETSPLGIGMISGLLVFG